MLGFFWRGKYSLEMCLTSLCNGKEEPRAVAQTCQCARPSCTRPRKLRITILQHGLAGGSNSNFLEKLQATRLENALRLGASSSVLYLHCLVMGCFCGVFLFVCLWGFFVVVVVWIGFVCFQKYIPTSA